MPRDGFTVLAFYATVTRDDRARVVKFLNGTPVNAFLRGLVNDALEEAGERPLTPERVRGRKRKNGQFAPDHA